MQAASSNYAKLIFFPKALGKRKVISRSFTLFEKEKGHQIIAKKSHTVLSNFFCFNKNSGELIVIFNSVDCGSF